MKDNDEEWKKFEEDVLGDVSKSEVKAKEEEPIAEEKKVEAKDDCDDVSRMPLKELRKYYRTQMEKRRHLFQKFQEQQKYCKELRDKMKELSKK